jgi:hypothetical protein
LDQFFVLLWEEKKINEDREAKDCFTLEKKGKLGESYWKSRSYREQLAKHHYAIRCNHTDNN